jgi:hypothetical protein
MGRNFEDDTKFLLSQKKQDGTMEGGDKKTNLQENVYENDRCDGYKYF